MKILAATMVLAVGLLVSMQSSVWSMEGLDSARHLLVGTWELNYQGCIETHQYMRNGIHKSTSLDEEMILEYDLSDQQTNMGFYRYTSKVISDNGQTDCTGSDSQDAGMKIDRYLSFRPDKKQFMLCSDPEGTRCMGWFVRKVKTANLDTRK